MNHSSSKRKFKLTTLQWSALIILPLFVFALFMKIQERQEAENYSELFSTEDNHKENYMIQTVSQPVIHNPEEIENSDSAK
ncbi:hypothetical protein WAF17_21850 [Bernardetia sp. ABR2-2B]|uniref:hypothetical protein n=1 Tax=Bernardetia sp. ABR2-2B TaxID=3127472 RepID=UPI0030CA69EA